MLGLTDAYLNRDSERQLRAQHHCAIPHISQYTASAGMISPQSLHFLISVGSSVLRVGAGCSATITSGVIDDSLAALAALGFFRSFFLM